MLVTKAARLPDKGRSLSTARTSQCEVGEMRSGDLATRWALPGHLSSLAFFTEANFDAPQPRLQFRQTLTASTLSSGRSAARHVVSQASRRRRDDDLPSDVGNNTVYLLF